MFTYIRLKNFLSLGDVTFDFKKSGTATKRFVAIYGENGSGKSNFVKSIDLLCRSMTSFNLTKRVERLFEQMKEGDKQLPEDIIQEILRESDVTHYISACRTVDCQEPTEIEYGFALNGHEGVYKLSFADRFTGESLYYFTGKQRGYLFNIGIDDGGTIISKFHGGLFSENKVRAELTDEVKQYWGKHTFMAILRQQIEEKNESYIEEAFSEYLLSVIHHFEGTTVVCKASNRKETGMISGKPDNVLKNLRSGNVAKSKLPMLQRSERILREFFTQAYSDIKDVAYEIENNGEDRIRYQLFVDKMIAGKVRRISFENESAGTQQVLEIVRTLLGLFCGVTVVYDEIDNGVHDVLLSQIINSLVGEINGQLIITTHNTMLLKEMDPHSAYIIQVDYRGNKEVHCMAEFPVQANNNLQVRYLKGVFGGTPYVDGIDYDDIAQAIGEGGEDD